MNSNRVTLDVSEQIGHVRLNRPNKHNAIDMPMYTAIDDVFKKIKKNKDIRVVIVSGEGESFCSGIDIKSVLSNPVSAVKLLWKYLPGNANLAQRVSVGWRRLPVPVIMVLHGKCWGGGMQIALGGDFRIAAEDCSLSIMESRWGLIPDMGGTLGLLESVRGDQALKLAMTSETIEAKTAQSIGLVTQIAADPMASALSLAKQLLQRSPDTNRVIKRVYHSIWCKEHRRILAQETINQIGVIMGKNQRIAVKREMHNMDIAYKK